MRGRRPKPTALKKLQGNPGHRKLNEREPQLTSSVPLCPDFLQGAARKEWKRMAELLGSSNLLTEVDRTALAAYCQAYQHWIDAEASIRKFGSVVKSPSGYPMLSPYVALAKTAMAQMHKMLVEFGMTPSSRSRLRIEQPATGEDPLEAFLKRGATTKASAMVQ